MLSQVGDHATCECTCALTTDLALPVWEYLITLANEIDLFWRKPVTAPSILFIATRWIMLANALLQFAPATEETYDSIPLLRMSDIDTFLSNCNAVNWAVQVLYLAGFIATACKQAHATTTSLLCVLNGTQHFLPYEYLPCGDEAIHGPVWFCFWELFL